jgi:glycosyltransferase involved in cell wall biosynthesis
MYKNNKISISIPAYNEENHILDTLKGIPEFVDFVVVSNDCSKDKTVELVSNYSKKDKRVHLINLDKNSGGPGLPIQLAHKKGIELGADVLVVINGDNQMVIIKWIAHIYLYF